MEGWRQGWRLGGRKTLSNEKTKRTHLTPTGLLMEGDYTHNPGHAMLCHLNVLVWWSLARFTQDHGSVHSLDQILLCRRHRAIFFQTHLLEGTPVHFFALLKRQVFGPLRVQHLESVSLDAGIFGRLLLRFLLQPPLLCPTQRMNFRARRRRLLLCLRNADIEVLDQTHHFLGVEERHLVLH